MAKLYIGDLGEKGSRSELEREFEKFGPIKEIWVARNPPGFAFITYENIGDAEDAIQSLNGRKVCGSRIRVETARQKDTFHKRSPQNIRTAHRRRRVSRSGSRSRSRSISRLGLDTKRKYGKSSRSRYSLRRSPVYSHTSDSGSEHRRKQRRRGSHLSSGTNSPVNKRSLSSSPKRRRANE